MTIQHTAISIHAPSRERLQSYDIPWLVTLISIHAPSRERPLEMLTSKSLTHFNPRSLTGATSRVTKSTTNDTYFNPRSLTGATAFATQLRQRRKNFNPRSLTGATFIIYEPRRNKEISIHAPSRERHDWQPLQSCQQQFQSTLPHGSDL